VPNVNDGFVVELVEAGIDRREARWLVEEFMPGGDPASRGAVLAAATRRLHGEPLQYILGHWPFRSLDLDVDPRALIPRPETEELVDVALRELASAAVPAPLIVDLGTGSGAIGLSLVSELLTRGVAASLIAVDESDDALALARQNARKHGLGAVSFVHSSWFSSLDLSLRGRVDLIVANPPYVGENEFGGLDPVLRHEPRGAIIAPDLVGVTGFADLDIVVREAHAWLAPGGALVCEHGENHRRAVLELTDVMGYRFAEDLDDLSGRPRILVARR
jgi:release factor glutamine methyltransferase